MSYLLFVDAEMESPLPNPESSDLQHLHLKGNRLTWKSRLYAKKKRISKN